MSSLISLVDPADEGDGGLRSKRNRNREYTFDHAFDETSTQEEVFRLTTFSLIEHVANGFNATVFASGSTGSGKTHTMVGTDRDPGIMVRAMDELFNYMIQTEEEYTYRVSMAYMELYNELIRDLLNPGPDFLELREDSKGVQVVGLYEVEPTNRDEVFKLLQRGNLNRTTEPTAANMTSSRSHAILQITVRQSPRTPSIQEEIRIGKLFLIDLAGSERASKTLNRGKRMTEGAHINRSLLALGNCINALSDTSNRKFVNYRDSKLTRLLKDSLAGNCRTVMIAHISPSSWQFDETCNTLVYANRAKSIKTKVRRNVVDVDRHISQYTELINELHEEITRLKMNLNTGQTEKEPDPHTLELNRLKDELLDDCQVQLDLRRHLVRLKNRLLELNLEETRYNEWDSSKASSVTASSATESQTNLDGIRDASYAHHYPIIHSYQFMGQAREALRQERRRLEEAYEQVEKDHEIAADNVKRMQKSLLSQSMRSEEREIIDLLCRLHELELERADLDAQYALSGTELKRREFLLNQLRVDSRLSEAIIRYQADLLAHNNVETPKELLQLLELYAQQTNLGAQRRVSVGSSVSDVRFAGIHLTNGDSSKVSNSLSSIPFETAIEGHRYQRTTNWLKTGAGRRASLSDGLSTLGIDRSSNVLHPLGSHMENSQSERVTPSKKQMNFFSQAQKISPNATDTETSTAQSHNELPSTVQNEEDGVKHSESSSLENMRPGNLELGENLSGVKDTRTISLVAQQRREQRLKVVKQKQRRSQSVAINQDVDEQSDTGENVEISVLHPPVYLRLSPPPAEGKRSDTHLLVEAQKYQSRRSIGRRRDDQSSSEANFIEQRAIPIGKRSPSQSEQPSITTGDIGYDWSQGPITRPIKVVPLEVKNQKRALAQAKMTRPRNETYKSEIPRPRSNSRKSKPSPSLKGNEIPVPVIQAPQIAKVHEQTTDGVPNSPQNRRTSIGPAASRKSNHEGPWQQKTAVDRRYNRTVRN
ncbi:Kinesin-like protein kif19 [Clonorchis sinensis]|uniref:Kinesin-like protein n=1 Tax=Clonorchis sinensis TaxID=79923 RepID=A0A8T1MAN2_CLOSI|nr:Kinesin-like protein kif19 [Clonorchis sinensis]